MQTTSMRKSGVAGKSGWKLGQSPDQGGVAHCCPLYARVSHSPDTSAVGFNSLDGSPDKLEPFKNKHVILPFFLGSLLWLLLELLVIPTLVCKHRSARVARFTFTDYLHSCTDKSILI